MGGEAGRTAKTCHLAQGGTSASQRRSLGRGWVPPERALRLHEGQIVDSRQSRGYGRLVGLPSAGRADRGHTPTHQPPRQRQLYVRSEGGARRGMSMTTDLSAQVSAAYDHI